MSLLSEPLVKMIRKIFLLLLLCFMCLELVYIVFPYVKFGYGQTGMLSVTTNSALPYKRMTIPNSFDKIFMEEPNLIRNSVRDSVTVNVMQADRISSTSNRRTAGFHNTTTDHRTMLSENERKLQDNKNLSKRKKLKLWEEQLRRHQIMTKVCESYNIAETFTPDINFTFRMLVNEKFKFVFTYIPKVGCKTWKSVLGRIYRSSHDDNNWLNRLSKYNDHDRERILREYKKVIFVRDPMVRFLSAYLDKFQSRNHIQKVWDTNFGQDIIRKYRNSSENVKMKKASQPRGRFLDVRLEEFMQYILELGNTSEMTGLTDHWLPQSIVSHVCHIRYDFIGKYEHLDNEAPFLLQWLGITSVKFPKVHGSKAEDSLKTEFSNVSIGLILKLPEYYYKDYALFDYDPKEIFLKIRPT